MDFLWHSNRLVVRKSYMKSNNGFYKQTQYNHCSKALTIVVISNALFRLCRVWCTRRYNVCVTKSIKIYDLWWLSFHNIALIVFERCVIPKQCCQLCGKFCFAGWSRVRCGSYWRYSLFSLIVFSLVLRAWCWHRLNFFHVT